MNAHGNFRQRDAARTKADLLLAARELFGQQGYTRTTLRDIGEHAGADAALIARYFGSKASLYIATLETDDSASDDSGKIQRPSHEGIVERVINRTTRLGPGPILQAAVTPSDEPEIRRAARRILQQRTIGPLRDRIHAAGHDRADLRAEIAAAALAGIALARVAGTLDVLANASPDDVVEVTQELLNEFLDH